MDYFTKIAKDYDDLRGMECYDDLAKVVSRYTIKGSTMLDIACGTGRFSIPLCDQFRLRLQLLDNNPAMLEVAKDRIAKQGGQVGGHDVIYRRLNSRIILDNNIGLDKVNIFTCMNALHHLGLDFIPMLASSSSANANLLILTRLKDQNDRSFLGQHFRDFAKKEDRLFQMDEIISACKMTNMTLNEAKEYSYSKEIAKEDLIKSVESKLYSTFALYTQEEFHDALTEFKDEMKNYSEVLKFQSELAILVFEFHGN